jgi:oxygen-independent coproporphyrinogen-3 oxidase
MSGHQIGQLLQNIRSRFKVLDNAEITIEANPGTVNTSYLFSLKKHGINRISLGVQAFDDRLLRLLGRLHNSREAISALNCMRMAGFANISIDLIYGIPCQTETDWKTTLNAALDMQPEHLSLYCLSLEEGTDLFRLIRDGHIPPINADHSADQYEIAEDLLAAHGYHQYEISNWCKTGYECKHNLSYWHNESYLGIGVAACSYYDHTRKTNTCDLDKYINGLTSGVIPIEHQEYISPQIEQAEAIMLELRLNRGVNPTEYNFRYNTDIITRYKGLLDELVGLDLIRYDQSKVILTRKGRLLGNEVFFRFLP